MRGKKKTNEERCQKIDSAGKHEGHTFRSIKTTHNDLGLYTESLGLYFKWTLSLLDLYHQPLDFLSLVVNHINQTFLRTRFPIYRYA